MTFDSFLASGIDALVDQVLPLVGVLVAIGGAAMALWQVLKDVFPVRQNFNKKLLLEWADGDSEALHHLLKLAAVGDCATNALYALPTAQLVGQLQAAGRVTVADPQHNSVALNLLLGQANAPLATAFIDDATPLHDPQIADDGGDAQFVAATIADRELALRRSQVEHYVQRRFDGLQIRADWRWGRYNRAVTLAMSVVLTWISLGVAGTLRTPTVDWPSAFLVCAPVALAAGAVAGFLAPVGKDLVRALRALRYR